VSVALVTDSTAYLSPAVVDVHGISVVPLHVIIAGQEHSEGVDVTADEVAAALRSFAPVSTSRPSPSAFLRAYEAAAAAGAEAIVSVHISADMSSTIDSARLAAEQSPVPVTVVDSRSMGMAMGYAVLSACDAARAGASAAEVAEVARRRAEGATVVFYVDTLEHLRRGGRIGAAAALLGSALAIKPILALADGRIQPLERVRTSVRALSRIEELAVSAAEAAPDGFDIAVHHLDSRSRADDLAARLRERLGDRLSAPPAEQQAGLHAGLQAGGDPGLRVDEQAGLQVGQQAGLDVDEQAGLQVGQQAGRQAGQHLGRPAGQQVGEEGARSGELSGGALGGPAQGGDSGGQPGGGAEGGPSEGAGELVVVELGAVVGAHVGPGTLAVVVSPRLGV
jgi:DegV family protein with EDD domain